MLVVSQVASHYAFLLGIRHNVAVLSLLLYSPPGPSSLTVLGLVVYEQLEICFLAASWYCFHPVECS